MFETAVVSAPGRKAKKRWGLLTASILAHTGVVLTVVAVSLASTEFPAVAPDEYRVAPLFVPVTVPPPLGNPNAGRPQPVTQPAPKPAARPTEITAPSIVPETVTPAAGPPSTGPVVDPNATATGTGTEPGPLGVEWGVEDRAGDPDGPPAVEVPAQPQIEEKVYQPHEVKAPVLLHKVEPRYPPSLIRSGVPGTVVVRCVIDRNGRVRDPEVIVPASMPPFNAEVLRVITQWRFTPGSVRGQAVDSYFNLTVRFAVTR